MKAILQTDAKRVEVRDIAKPTPGPQDVLVDVEHAGICGSDVHAYLLMDGFDWVKIPRVMGHEYAGSVVETGEDVTNVEVGDTVIEAPIHPCGNCPQCEVGDVNVCSNTTISGMHTDGAYSEFVAVDEQHLLTCPDGLSSQHAALTEPLSIAARAVYDRSSVTPGDTVLVQGPGPIGILTAGLLDAMGAKVLLSGKQRDQKYRLPLADSLDISTVNVNSDSLMEYMDGMTDGTGFDSVFDTTGHRSGIEGAVDLVRKGGEIIVVGLPGEPAELFFSPIVRAELDILAAYGSTPENFKQAMRGLDAGHIDADRLIDTRYDVETITDAFEDFLESKTCKPVLAF